MGVVYIDIHFGRQNYIRLAGSGTIWDAVSVRCPEYGGVRFSKVSKVLLTLGAHAQRGLQ